MTARSRRTTRVPRGYYHPAAPAPGSTRRCWGRRSRRWVPRSGGSATRDGRRGLAASEASRDARAPGRNGPVRGGGRDDPPLGAPALAATGSSVTVVLGQAAAALRVAASSPSTTTTSTTSGSSGASSEFASRLLAVLRRRDDPAGGILRALPGCQDRRRALRSRASSLIVGLLLPAPRSRLCRHAPPAFADRVLIVGTRARWPGSSSRRSTRARISATRSWASWTTDRPGRATASAIRSWARCEISSRSPRRPGPTGSSSP